MTGSYGTDAVEIFFFGPKRTPVDEFAQKAKKICTGKGVEADGPLTPPSIEIAEDHPAFSSNEELFGQPPTEEERQMIPGAQITRRILRIYNSGDVVKEIVSQEPPESVFLRVTVGNRSHGKGGKGTPHTYDPNLDYKTEP